MLPSLLFIISLSNPTSQRWGPDLYYFGNVLNWAVRSTPWLFDDLGVRVGPLSASGTPSPASTIEGSFLLSHLVILRPTSTIDHSLRQVTCKANNEWYAVGLLERMPVKQFGNRASGNFHAQDAFFPPLSVCVFVCVCETSAEQMWNFFSTDWFHSNLDKVWIEGDTAFHSDCVQRSYQWMGYPVWPAGRTCIFPFSCFPSMATG